MDMVLSPDERQLQASIQQFLEGYKVLPKAEAVSWIGSDKLEAELVDSGYLDIGRTEGLGTFESMLLVEAVSQIPYSIEVSASALVGPRVSADPLPRPLAMARTDEAGRISGPVRYLPVAKAILVDTGKDVRLLDVAKCKFRSVDTLFAYPIGVIEQADLGAAKVLGGVTTAALRHAWQLALATEILGCANSAIDITLNYLKERQQFGKHIGSFQALQHRISECVTMLESLRILVYRAATTNKPADAAVAAFYAQDVAPRIILDTQQMHGAMGCTLEYPLHFWTYRMKVLQGELGGSLEQAVSAADLLWAA